MHVDLSATEHDKGLDGAGVAPTGGAVQRLQTVTVRGRGVSAGLGDDTVSSLGVGLDGTCIRDSTASVEPALAAQRSGGRPSLSSTAGDTPGWASSFLRVVMAEGVVLVSSASRPHIWAA